MCFLGSYAGRLTALKKKVAGTEPGHRDVFK